jgi:hypothetical protein
VKPTDVVVVDCGGVEVARLLLTQTMWCMHVPAVADLSDSYLCVPISINRLTCVLQLQRVVMNHTESLGSSLCESGLSLSVAFQNLNTVDVDPFW